MQLTINRFVIYLCITLVLFLLFIVLKIFFDFYHPAFTEILDPFHNREDQTEMHALFLESAFNAILVFIAISLLLLFFHMKVKKIPN